MRLIAGSTICIALLLSTCVAQSSNTPDFPLLHKDASELSIRFTEDVMRGGPALLSTAAFRYGLVLTDPLGSGWKRGTLEYTLDWLPAIVLTHPKVVYGLGVAPFGIKWNFVGKPRLHPYAELVLGGVLSTSNIPPGDTLNINFTVHAGGGLTLYTRGRQSLTAGLDFSHLSNAYLGANNPEYNGFSFVLQYLWLRPR